MAEPNSSGNNSKLSAGADLKSALTKEQLEKITSKESPELLAQNKLALRVGVESGGCHGYQYTMELVEERGVDD